jgi:hypothetical protein
MKKLILSFIIGTLSVAGLSAQCTPDPNVTSGISPDTASNLPPAYTGQAYDEVITFKVPQDTMYLGAPITVAFVKLDSVTGLPNNFTTNCTPTNCQFPGGQNSCVRLYSTSDPTVPQIGAYQLGIFATPYVLISQFLPPVASTQSSYDGYILLIVEGEPATIERLQPETFKSLMAIPNPSNSNTRIQFASGYNTEVTFTVTNLLGKTMMVQKFAATRGVNEINYDVSSLANGVYLYTISDGKNTVSKKLVVNK